jgi:hypothetical protein
MGEGRLACDDINVDERGCANEADALWFIPGGAIKAACPEHPAPDGFVISIDNLATDRRRVLIDLLDREARFEEPYAARLNEWLGPDGEEALVERARRLGEEE